MDQSLTKPNWRWWRWWSWYWWYLLDHMLVVVTVSITLVSQHENTGGGGGGSERGGPDDIYYVVAKVDLVLLLSHTQYKEICHT